MTIQLYRLGDQLTFPHPDLALEEPNGLLAFGGDLSVERLLCAYENGIFPWFSEGEPLLWWSPDPRGVLSLDDYHCSSSLQKFIKKTPLTVTLNKNFDGVVEACADIPRKDNGTWITEQMIKAYQRMHQAGFGHSVEVWQGDALVGGLYGIGVGKVFCGESMFHKVTNASKLAMYCLVQHLRKHGFAFIDCQMQTEHLKSMGAKEVTREHFLSMLKKALVDSPENGVWKMTSLLVNKN